MLLRLADLELLLELNGRTIASPEGVVGGGQLKLLDVLRLAHEVLVPVAGVDGMAGHLHRRDQGDKLFPDVQRTHAVRAHHPLVTGHGVEIHTQLSQVKINVAHTLSAVYQREDTLEPCQLLKLLNGHPQTGLELDMAHEDQLGTWGDGCFHLGDDAFLILSRFQRQYLGHRAMAPLQVVAGH